MNVARNVMTEPLLVPGGGAAEMALAQVNVYFFSVLQLLLCSCLLWDLWFVGESQKSSPESFPDYSSSCFSLAVKSSCAIWPQ